MSTHIQKLEIQAALLHVLGRGESPSCDASSSLLTIVEAKATSLDETLSFRWLKLRETNLGLIDVCDLCS